MTEPDPPTDPAAELREARAVLSTLVPVCSDRPEVALHMAALLRDRGVPDIADALASLAAAALAGRPADPTTSTDGPDTSTERNQRP